jgi:hypothetical protein
MRPAELLEALLALADEVELPVRVLRSGATTSPGGGGELESDLVPTSTVCRIRGQIQVVLASQEPAEVQIQLLAKTLNSEASERLAGRFLPPAIRALLDQAAEDDAQSG